MIPLGHFQRVLLFLLIVALNQVAIGPNTHAKTLPVGNPDHAEGNLLQGLAQITPPGWNLSKPAMRFTPENLWEQIDGRAEFFLAYGVVKMLFAQYTESSNPEVFIDVSIYDMGNRVNAFGVFAAERQEEISPVELGREGYRMGAHLFIWRGSYYVRMIASKDSPGLRKMNMQMAEELTHLLYDSGEPLWGLQTLPKADRVTGSEQYFRRDALGLDFMTDTYTARYQKKDVLITVFLMRKEHPAAAEDIVRRYAAYAKQFGEGIREVTRHGVAILLCDMDGSYDALFRKGNIVGGVPSIEDPRSAVDFAYELWQRLPAWAHEKQK